MSLFKRSASRKGDEIDGANQADGTDEAGEVDPVGDVGGPAPSPPGSSWTFDRADGPLDRGEVDGPDGRLDLGALWLPLVEGIELQLQMDESSGEVTGAFVVLGDSAVQLQAFAAPRSEGIWREVCEEIAAGITEQGGTADPGYGRFGRELLARIPTQQPDGKVAFQPLRFSGVDGPRWLLRAVFHGPAAVDPDAAQPLEQLVSRVVVVRGSGPMGPHELLPLRLPTTAEEVDDSTPHGGPGAAHQPGEDLGPQERIAQDEAAQSFGDLQPFERGPEITERR